MGAQWTPTLIFVSINLHGLFGSLVVIYIDNGLLVTFPIM